MSDVVEHGREDSGGLPLWARRSALGAAGLLALVVLIPSGLLSGTTPEPPDRSPGPTDTDPAPTEARVLVRDGRQIIGFDRYGVDIGPALPRGFSDRTELYVVDNGGDPALIFGVVGGRLLRFQVGAATRSDLGTATRVVDVSPRPGELFVQTAADDGARVVSVDARSGQVVDPAPFSGYDGSPEWTPFGVLSLFGVDGLMLRRPPGRGEAAADELAVAWATAEVDAGRRQRFQALGRHGRLLGLTDEWVLLLAGRCPSPACTLQILSVGREGSTIREVGPPRGWSFSPRGAAGRTVGALVPVVALTGEQGDGAQALARLAAGGDSGLLVAGTTGVVHDAGLVQQDDGDVYFVGVGAEGTRRVLRWDPALPGQVSLLGPLPPLPETARLVCVCS